MAVTPVPKTGKTLYRPQREMSRPLKMKVMSIPPTMGRSWRPALVGVAPWTVWR